MRLLPFPSWGKSPGAGREFPRTVALHEGRRFLCRGGGDETLALFSHGGSAGFLMAHLLALPYPYVASVLPYDFASITTISFPVTEGEWVFPRVELFNDCGHIRCVKGRG